MEGWGDVCYITFLPYVLYSSSRHKIDLGSHVCSSVLTIDLTRFPHFVSSVPGGVYYSRINRE